MMDRKKLEILGECRRDYVVHSEASTTAESAFTAVNQGDARLLPSSSPHRHFKHETVDKLTSLPQRITELEKLGVDFLTEALGAVSGVLRKSSHVAKIACLVWGAS